MSVSKREPGGLERRRYPRQNQKIRVDMHLDAHESDIKGETCNLSPVGVYCEVDRPIPEMTQLMIFLELPDQQIECEGTVVRSEPGSHHSPSHRLAIFCHKISDEAKRQLADYLES